jgi:hypothetical protein
MQKRLDRLEQKVDHLESTLEYEQTVAGIRRGLESIPRTKGISAKKAFASIRRKHRSPR